MKFYDAHIHFYFKIPAEELKGVFCRLQEIGMAGCDALVFAEFPGDLKTVLKMVPAAYHNSISIPTLEMQKDPFPYFAWAKPLRIIPFVDARFIDQGIEEKMAGFKERGFRGLKLLYIPEEDGTIGVQGMEQAFGRSVKKSEEITARLIDSADSLGMPVLFHVDLRRYGDFVKEMIASHPQTNFNIPHFGSSRKAIRQLLDNYPNCYTDTASLVPFMEEDPQSYLTFMRQYQDRVLYGSDALIGNPEHVASTLSFLERFVPDQEILPRLVHNNYLAFHRIPGPAS